MRVSEGVPLTREEVLGANFTALARIAAAREGEQLLFPQAARDWTAHTGLRGLPIAVHITKEDGTKVPIELRENQLEAIRHIERCERSTSVRGPILRMQMGLGKTLTAISWVLMAPTSKDRSTRFPTLVLTSKTVLGVWKRDGFEKFGVDARVLYFHRDYLTSAEMDAVDREKVLTYDFVITTYDIVTLSATKDMKVERASKEQLLLEDIDRPDATGRSILFHTPWERVIADESQRFANPKTHAYKSVMCLYGERKMCLTGTPVRNYATDLWAQLRFCGYTGTMKQSIWRRDFMNIIPQHSLMSFILSQDYESADITLPKKIEHRQHVVLTGIHKEIHDYTLTVLRRVYNAVFGRGKANITVNDEMLASKVDTMSVLKLFLVFRLVCIAPYLLTDEAKRGRRDLHAELSVARNMLPELYLEEGPLWKWTKQRFGEAGAHSVKIQTVVGIIRAIPPEEKVVVFSMFTCSLDLVRDALEEERFTWGSETAETVLQLDGETPANTRQEILAKFEDDKNARVLLMTYKTGAEGINLTCASHVIELEPWWTDSVKQQAEARCWRFGQSKTVHVYPLFVKDSIEEHVLRICSMKNEMITRMFGDDPVEGMGGPNMAMLGYLLGNEASLPAPKKLRSEKDRAALRSAHLRFYDPKYATKE